jgi:hypothetical protein
MNRTTFPSVTRLTAIALVLVTALAGLVTALALQGCLAPREEMAEPSMEAPAAPSSSDGQELGGAAPEEESPSFDAGGYVGGSSGGEGNDPGTGDGGDGSGVEPDPQGTGSNVP